MERGVLGHLRAHASPRVRLVLCGIASIAIWVAALFFRRSMGPLGGFIIKPTSVPGVGPVWLMLLLFVPYAAAYRIVSANAVPGARRIIGAFAGLSCLVLIARIIPTASYDLYLYSSQGSQIAQHGLNPYAITPAMAPDIFTSHMGAFLANMKAVYGPLWLDIAALASAVTRGDPVALVVALKMISAAFFAGCIFLLSVLADELSPSGARPALKDGALLLFAWNPAALFEFAGNGHNDVVMIFFLLLAILFAVRSRWASAGFAMAASIMVKYVTLLCLPFLLLFAVSGKGRSLGSRAAAAGSVLFAAAIAAVAAFTPYWIGRATFDGLAHQSGLIGVDVASPFVYAAAISLLGLPDVTMQQRWDAAAVFARIVFQAAMFILVFFAYKKKVAASDLHRFAFAPMIVYLALSCFWLMPWYLTWLAPLFVLEGAAAAAIIVSFFGFLLYSAVFTGPLLGAAAIAVTVSSLSGRRRGTASAALFSRGAR